MTEPLVYLNGQIVPASQAHLAIYDAGVVQGATVTDQARTFHHRPYRLDEHIDRLFRSLHCTGITIELKREQVRSISLELVEANARLLRESDELGVLQFVTAGAYPTYAGLTGGPARPGPTVCIHTFPLPFELWASKMRSGAHLVTPSIRHVPPECYNPAVKYRSRLHFFLADQEARRVDPEASALLLDLQGNLTETSTANFLMAKGGTLFSPTLINIMPGNSRATVIELAGKLGIPFEVRDLGVADVLKADEAFLTSTPYCMMPVTKFNGARIGPGRPGPIFRRLIEAWSTQVGLDIENQILRGETRSSS